MRKLLGELCLLGWLLYLLLYSWVLSSGAASPTFLGLATEGSAPSYLFFEDFNTDDTGDVAGNTDFDTEFDASSRLSILSNKLKFDAADINVNGYVRSDQNYQIDEFTIIYKVTFDDVLEVAEQAGRYMHLCRSYMADNAQNTSFSFGCTSSRDIVLIHALGVNDDESNTADTTVISPAADTEYSAYIYAKRATTVDSNDGIVEHGVYIGSWKKATVSTLDNNGKFPMDYFQFGGVSNGFGSGTTDTNLFFDDVTLYEGDQRP